MSLVRTALRLATLNALRGATIADVRVYDSRVDDFSPENFPADALPTIILLTDAEEGPALSTQNGGPPFRRMIELVIEMGMVQTFEVPEEEGGSSFVPGYPTTDAEHESQLDLLEYQIKRRLGSDLAPESALWRTVALRVHKYDCHRQVMDETGVKIAARVLTWQVECTDDQIEVFRTPAQAVPTGLDALPEPLRKVAKALPADSYGRKLCENIAAAIAPPLTVGPLKGLDVTTDNTASGVDDASHQVASTIDLPQ